MDVNAILAGRYELLRPLGVGGFGVTYVACDRHLPGTPRCVVKQLKPIQSNPESWAIAQRLFNQEAKVLYQLGHHPHIPQLFAHFEEAGQFYLVQEYIDGQSLADELTAGDVWSESEVFALLKEILTILAEVHRQGVIHRDIKPSNIMRRRGDRALCLIDFGAVKAVPVLTGNGLPTVAVGSPGYMPREQQAGQPCFASDLYAVGMVALQALTGKLPSQFSRDPATGTLQFSELGDRPLSSALQMVLKCLLHEDPRQRYRDASIALRHITALGDTPDSVQDGQPDNAPSKAWTLPPATALPAPTMPPEMIYPAAIPLSPQEIRNRQALLNKVHRFWIQGVLDTSLHGQVMLTLGLEEQPEAIAQPWQLVVQLPQQAARELPQGTEVIEIFDQLGVGRTLLILGEPGSGKTTTLLGMARSLLIRANQSVQHPIPVVFNLSSWTGEKAIAPWLVDELNAKYQIPRAIGQGWIDRQQLLLLLDGLDEVRGDRRNACIQALNQFHQTVGLEVVICSRTQDYQALQERLQVQSAVQLRALRPDQICDYLNRISQGLTGLRTLIEQEIRQPERDQALLTLARSPLMLSILTLTYQGVASEELPQSADLQDYRFHLFEAYITRMFQRRSAHHVYSQDQTLHWLQRLAQTLQRTSQTVFLIERMQPLDWLTAVQQRWYAVGIWVSFLIIASGIGALVIRPGKLFLSVLVGGLIFGWIFGVNRIVPAETLKWSWAIARRNLLWGISLGPLIGVGLKWSFGLLFQRLEWGVYDVFFQEQMVQGVLFGLVFGFTFGVIRGLSGAGITTVTVPNQGIWQSAKNALMFAAIAIQIPMIVAWVIGGTKVLFWALFGLAFGLATGGGEACIKHGVLRLVLWGDRAIPWNYARFLDYATDRIFLQKVGGGYIFIHRLLLEHFATRHTIKNRNEGTPFRYTD
jgi:serine/threonine protein kinase